MDQFVQAYLECAMWSSTDESRDDGGDPIDANYGFEDFAPETVTKAERACALFLGMAQPLMDAEDNRHSARWNNEEMAGHDFWLTRNGHGAGFWDGDWTTHGNALTTICKVFGECSLYVGDDGKVYQS